MFYKMQKEYKKLIKGKRKSFEENTITKLESLYSQDKNEFWKYLKSMKKSSGITQTCNPFQESIP